MSLSTPQSELLLAALRYLAGELEAAEADAFEQRLGVEEAAQQALVQAVRVSVGVLSGPAVPAVLPAVRRATQRRPERTSRWSAGAALAGCAVVGATVLIALREEPESVSVVSADEESPGVTVSLWSELDVEEVEAALDEPGLPPLDSAETDMVQVPEWMFAAIESETSPVQSPLDTTDEET